jgi:hypothetical protein
LPSRAEFAALDKANGGTGVGRAWCSDDVTCQFWLPGYGWKGIYSGIVSFTGKLNGQGVRGDFWTRDQDQPFHANSLSANAYNGGSVDPGSSGISKSDAVAIRCLAN